LGLQLPSQLPENPEHRLYDLLAGDDPDSAHSRYNAYIRKLVSCERAAECVKKVTTARLDEFMRALAGGGIGPVRIFLVGGASAVLLGWRDSTEVDLKFEPDSDELLRKLPVLKERLQINIELASPGDFIPEVPGWRERSAFIRQEGNLTFLHYDFYAQALAKIERWHELDIKDVHELIQRRLVEPSRLLELFSAIEARLYEYPAIDPAKFRSAVEAVVAEAINPES
jgi:hypothetical protein